MTFQKKSRRERYIVRDDVAGVAGFEPTNAGIKIQCLTAWRHPNENMGTQA
jgi:hypothetical protein